MRRSKRVGTLLAGGALMGLGLAGCEDRQEDVRVFPTEQACAAERPAEECRDAFASAEREHLATAPRFRTLEECEAAMGPGACTVQQSGGGSFFMPLMMGYLLGNALNQPRPVYVDRKGFMHSPGGVLGRAPARDLRGGPTSMSVPRSTVTGTSRGGFGASGRAFSGSGG